MANLVLPYPDMDFVPLDILTATEMNQMVANDQAIASFSNGLADGTNLSDSAIQLRHLSLPAITVTTSATYSTTGTFVPYDNVASVSGTGLSLDSTNRRVVVDGNLIKKVMVSAHTQIGYQGDGYTSIDLQITTSETPEASGNISYAISSKSLNYFDTVVNAPKLVDVTTGVANYIMAHCVMTNSSTVLDARDKRGVYLTVQAVA